MYSPEKKIVTLLASFILVLLTDCDWGNAQNKERPGRLSKEQRALLLPGLRAEVLTENSDVVDIQIRRTANLFIAADEPPSVFADLNKDSLYSIKLSGYIKLKLKGEYRFYFSGEGTLSALINRQKVVDSVELDNKKPTEIVANLVKGYNEIAFQVQCNKDRRLKLHSDWSSDDFVREPLPPVSLFCVGKDEAAAKALSNRTGRQLFLTRKCATCHSLPDVVSQSPNAIEELTEKAPSLRQIANRLTTNWVFHWVQDPHAMRSAATMPNTLGHLPDEKRKEVAANLARFLSQMEDEQGADSYDPADARKGEILFEDRGCIACHRLTKPQEEDEFGRVSLFFANAKFQPNALWQFLLNPRAHYRSSRMPVSTLTKSEAQQIAAFIRENAEGKTEPFDDGDAKLGKSQFVEFSCANCHETSSDNELSFQKGLFGNSISLEAGCLSSESDKTDDSPKFHFDETQLASIRTFISSGPKSLTTETHSEYALRKTSELRCNACHQIDDEDSTYIYAYEDEGSRGLQPEAVPALTFAGEKLLEPWMEKLLEGKLAYRTREHYKIRMPAFPYRGKKIAMGLAAQHGYDSSTVDQEFVLDPEKATVGARIVAMESGLSCQRCHAINDKKAIAPFDAYSTNLGVAAERLRYSYYERWMFNPQRIDQSTRMLKFSPDLKTTGYDKEYNGDARKQFEAIWHFLHVKNGERK